VDGVLLRVLSAGFTVSGHRYTAQLAPPAAEAYTILWRFQWWLLVSIPLVLAVASAGGSERSGSAVRLVTSVADSFQSCNVDMPKK
jgi:hypothetical protein